MHEYWRDVHASFGLGHSEVLDNYKTVLEDATESDGEYDYVRNSYFPLTSV